MNETKRNALGVSLVVFLVTAIVYFITLCPTVPFWDAGEFIAVSYILGIPHPPGTPFYVLVGRIATMVPFGSIAQRVNGLSAIAGILTVVLTFLTCLKLIRLAQGRGPAGGARSEPSGAVVVAQERKGWSSSERTDEWIALAGAFVGALLLAFSDSFWENAIEAEVYSLMSLAQILVLWLGLRWWEAHEKRPTAGPLLVCVYVMWLCVGLHLGVGIMGLPLLLLVWLVDRRAALVFLIPYVSVMVVTKGLEFMAGTVILLSLFVFLVMVFRKQLNGWVWLGAAIAGLYGASYAFGDRDFTTAAAVAALLSVLLPLGFLMVKGREGKIIALSLILMIAGYSTHLYLPIRAAQHPAINEGAPDSWNRLRDLLERKQYGDMKPLERRAPLMAQLDKEFWRYFSRQWPLFPTDRLWGALLPLLLGLVGAWWQLRRERTSFLTTGCFFGLTTAGMIVFLNFTDHEVRERDYFFQSGYHAYTLWIGMGAAWLIGWVRDSFTAAKARDMAAVAAGALMVAQPILLLKNMWYMHDRRGNYVARDYAYNMLAPLAPNSFMFTNGDNDTFPLWYLQEVEGIRKDVRVVNLSLLNTDWYIRQLRDEEPKVPITLDDKTVDLLGMGVVRDQTGEYVYTSHFMVDHIMQENRSGNGWKKPPYFAVTVPERLGYEKYFTLEGLVYRVNPDSTAQRLDEEVTRKTMYETFKYRGLFKPDGSWDPAVYKDENASTLSRNYAAAHMELAYHYRRTGRLALAITEMQRVERMFPGSPDVLLPLGSFYIEAGDTVAAMRLFEDLAKQAPRDPDVRYYHGVSLLFQNKLEAALAEFEAAIALNPEHTQSYVAAFSLLQEMGQRERALGILEQWTRRHPEDPEARGLFERERRMQGGSAPGGEPPPSDPGKP